MLRSRWGAACRMLVACREEEWAFRWRFLWGCRPLQGLGARHGGRGPGRRIPPEVPGGPGCRENAGGSWSPNDPSVLQL